MLEVIIIGAGPAGLTAAYKLLKDCPDVHPIILESSEYVGGISRTQVFGGNRMDLGGHRFFTKSNEVMDLWTELMPLQGTPASDDLALGRMPELFPGGPDPSETDEVMLLRRRVSRIFFLKKFFDYPISLKPQTFINMGLFRTIVVGNGYLRAAAFQRQEKTLEDFYINRFGRPLYEMFFEDYTEKVWGVHPSKISPEWGAQRVKGLSLSEALLNVLAKPFKNDRKVETSLIEEFYYPKKGPGSLYERLADEVVRLGGELHTGVEVNSITVEQGKISSLYATDKYGKKMEFNPTAVFSSMAIKDLVTAMGDKPPKAIRDIAVALPYRDFMTVGLLVRELAIPNTSGIRTVSGVIPDCWIYIQDREVRLGRLQIFNNWSPYMVEDFQNTIFLGLEYFCDEGDEFWNMNDVDFTNMAIDELCSIGIISPDAVLDSTVVRVKKAYPAYFGAYDHFDTVRDWLMDIDNLYCIGRNGQHRYNNMDHSMLTAMEAVKAFMAGGKGKELIWQVNTEEDYHEAKS